MHARNFVTVNIHSTEVCNRDRVCVYLAIGSGRSFARFGSSLNVSSVNCARVLPNCTPLTSWKKRLARAPVFFANHNGPSWSTTGAAVSTFSVQFALPLIAPVLTRSRGLGGPCCSPLSICCAVKFSAFSSALISPNVGRYAREITAK